MPARPGCSRTERAQALVEFALVIPLYLLLTVALIDFARMLFTYVSLTNGTREMTRVAALSRKVNADVIGAFNNYALFLGESSSGDNIALQVVDMGGTTVSSTCSLNPRPLTSACNTLDTRRQLAAGGYVELTATHTFRFNPLFQGMLDRVSGLGSNLAFVLSTTARAYVE